MKLEEGMYVRTECGLIFKYYPCKNTEYDKESNIYHEWDDWGEYDNYYYVKKSSHNIIDLIEVGDYVNGKRVVDKWEEPDWYGYFIKLEGETEIPTIRNIKSIVTREMFSNAEYRVGTN